MKAPHPAFPVPCSACIIRPQAPVTETFILDWTGFLLPIFGFLLEGREFVSVVCWSQLRLPVEIFIVSNQNLPAGVKLWVVCNWPR